MDDAPGVAEQMILSTHGHLHNVSPTRQISLDLGREISQIPDAFLGDTSTIHECLVRKFPLPSFSAR